MLALSALTIYLSSLFALLVCFLSVITTFTVDTLSLFSIAFAISCKAFIDNCCIYILFLQLYRNILRWVCQSILAYFGKVFDILKNFLTKSNLSRVCDSVKINKKRAIKRYRNLKNDGRYRVLSFFRN